MDNGLSRAHLGEYAIARDNFRDAAVLAPRCALAWWLYGCAVAEVGRVKGAGVRLEAWECFDRCLGCFEQREEGMIVYTVFSGCESWFEGGGGGEGRVWVLLRERVRRNLRDTLPAEDAGGEGRRFWTPGGGRAARPSLWGVPAGLLLGPGGGLGWGGEVGEGVREGVGPKRVFTLDDHVFLPAPPVGTERPGSRTEGFRVHRVVPEAPFVASPESEGEDERDARAHASATHPSNRVNNENTTDTSPTAPIQPHCNTLASTFPHLPHKPQPSRRRAQSSELLPPPTPYLSHQPTTDDISPPSECSNSPPPYSSSYDIEYGYTLGCISCLSPEKSPDWNWRPVMPRESSIPERLRQRYGIVEPGEVHTLPSAQAKAQAQTQAQRAAARIERVSAAAGEEDQSTPSVQERESRRRDTRTELVARPSVSRVRLPTPLSEYFEDGLGEERDVEDDGEVLESRGGSRLDSGLWEEYIGAWYMKGGGGEARAGERQDHREGDGQYENEDEDEDGREEAEGEDLEIYLDRQELAYPRAQDQYRDTPGAGHMAPRDAQSENIFSHDGTTLDDFCSLQQHQMTSQYEGHYVEIANAAAPINPPPKTKDAKQEDEDEEEEEEEEEEYIPLLQPKTYEGYWPNKHGT